jgi:hypothetical protein
MAKAPDPLDKVYQKLMMELQEIDDRAKHARRFHHLMGQCTHIDMPVQYERLYLRSLGGKVEKTHDHPRGAGQSRRRRISRWRC